MVLKVLHRLMSIRCHVDIFLGECSLTLARNVDYEIPFYKRQKGKYQQQLLDLERKQTEHLHSAALAARNHQQVASAPLRSCAFNACTTSLHVARLVIAQKPTLQTLLRKY